MAFARMLDMLIGPTLMVNGCPQANTSNIPRTAIASVGARKHPAPGLENTWISRTRETAIAGFSITGGRCTDWRKYPNLLFAKDGEVYDLDGRQALVIGGAYSVDKYYRLSRGWGWWADEQPSPEIKARVEASIEQMGWMVDIVLSHTTPLKYEPVEVFLPGIDQSKVDKSTEEWLDSIEERLDYKKWYCGHYHTEKKIDRLQIMFNDYAALEAECLC